MKKRFIGIFLICAAAVVILSGCSFGGITEKGIEGEYANLHIESWSNYSSTDKLDNYLSKEIKENMEKTAEGIKDLKLKDGRFDMIYQYGSKQAVYFYMAEKATYLCGKYTVNDDGTIDFKYDKCKLADKEININDDSDDRQTKSLIERMNKLNENGIPCSGNFQPYICNENYSYNNVLPKFSAKSDELNNIKFKTDKNNEFIYSDTYGFYLEGDYKYSKDFKIKYSPLKKFKDDKDSIAYDSNDSFKETIKKISDIYYVNFETENKGNDKDLDTEFKFGNGEWKWYNGNGNLINNGKYIESKKYKGFILMYTDNDSEINMSGAQIYFYIAEDGKIYYPSCVKTK